MHLSHDSTNDGKAQQALSQAVEFGRSTTKLSDPFNFLITSLEHVVKGRLVDALIEHTEPLLLLDNPVHYTKHPSC